MLDYYQNHRGQLEKILTAEKYSQILNYDDIFSEYVVFLSYAHFYLSEGLKGLESLKSLTTDEDDENIESENLLDKLELGERYLKGFLKILNDSNFKSPARDQFAKDFSNNLKLLEQNIA